MNTFSIVDNQTQVELDTIVVLGSPTITQEINGAYTLDFDFSYLDRNKLSNGVLIQVDGQYFRVARITKYRNSTLNFTASCEHVSYDLINDGELEDPESFEGDLASMVSSFLSDTNFSVGSIPSTASQYYETSSLNIRERLIQVADLFQLEVVFDNFTIGFTPRLGDGNGETINLGRNLIGVSQETDYVNGRVSYEIDLVDLARLGGYQNVNPINLGDTITIIDAELGISANERVISISYDPFVKSLPTITVGQYARSLTEYVKEIEDEARRRDIESSLINTFRVGNVNMIPRVGDEVQAVTDYLLGASFFVRPSNVFNVQRLNMLRGLTVSLQREFSGYNAYIIRTTNENNSSTMEIVNLNDSAELAPLLTSTYPSRQVDALTLVVSDRTIDELRMNEELIEESELYAFGISIEVNDSSDARQYFYKIDAVNSTLDNETTSLINSLSNEFEQGMNFVLGSADTITPRGEYRLRKLEAAFQGRRFEYFRGLDIELIEEIALRGYNITLVSSTSDSTIDNLTTSTTELTSDVLDVLRATTLGDFPYSYLTFIVHERTLDELRQDPDLFYSSVFSVSSVRLVRDLLPTDPLSYFTRFSVGDVDLLYSLSNQSLNVAANIFTGTQFEIPSNEYELIRNVKGLFVERAPGTNGLYLHVQDLRILDNEIFASTSTPYNERLHEWNYTAVYDKRAIILTVSTVPYADITQQNFTETHLASFGITINGESEADRRRPENYFSQFMIGNENVLNKLEYANFEVEQYYVNNSVITVDSTVRVENQLRGITYTPKKAYENYAYSIISVDEYEQETGDLSFRTYVQRAQDANLETEPFPYDPLEDLEDKPIPPDQVDNPDYVPGKYYHASTMVIVISSMEIDEIDFNNINNSEDGVFFRAFGVKVEYEGLQLGNSGGGGGGGGGANQIIYIGRNTDTIYSMQNAPGQLEDGFYDTLSFLNYGRNGTEPLHANRNLKYDLVIYFDSPGNLDFTVELFADFDGRSYGIIGQQTSFISGRNAIAISAIENPVIEDFTGVSYAVRFTDANGGQVIAGGVTLTVTVVPNEIGPFEQIS